MSYSSFFKAFGRTVTFSPRMAGVIGRNETLLLSQFIFWTDWLERNEPDRKGWFFKNSTQIEEETSLTYKEQFTARQHLCDLGILIEETNKLEHTIYFCINQVALDDLITRHLADDNTPEGGTSTPQRVSANIPEGVSLVLSEKTSKMTKEDRAEWEDYQKRLKRGEERIAEKLAKKGKRPFQRHQNQPQERPVYESPAARRDREAREQVARVLADLSTECGGRGH